MTTVYLVGDVGGTNARLELFKIENGKEAQVSRKTYPAQKYTNLTSVVKQFIEEEVPAELLPIAAACFALAGPVEKDGTANITNLGWERFNEETMQKDLHIGQVKFINDFVGCGYGLLALSPNDLRPLSQHTKAEPQGLKAIIGAGTGLGEALLTHTGDEYIVHPGEGGHSDFSPRTKDEFELAQHIKLKHGLTRVGVERVVSGPGINNVYDYLRERFPDKVDEEIENEIDIRKNENNGLGDAGPIIAKRATQGDELCEKAISMFVAAFGAEAGNVGCRLLPYGGIYIAGGIAAKIFDLMKKHNTFMENFLEKGRMRQYLQNIPVYVVTNPGIGLLGAQVRCRRLLRDDGHSSVNGLSKLSPPVLVELGVKYAGVKTPGVMRARPSPNSSLDDFRLDSRSPGRSSSSSLLSLPPAAYVAIGVALSTVLAFGAYSAGQRSRRS